MSAFKNYRCLAHPPDAGGGWMFGYWWACQRKGDHPMPHRSRTREWNDGDRESQPRAVIAKAKGEQA